MTVEWPNDAHKPFAPLFLAGVINRERVQRRLRELGDIPSPTEQAEQGMELCKLLYQVEPTNPTWPILIDYLNIYLKTQGRDQGVILQYFNSVGAINNQGILNVTEWRSPTVTEFMDVDRTTYPEDYLQNSGIDPIRFFWLAEKCAAHAWNGFSITKTGLTDPHTGISLLTTDLIQEIDRLPHKNVCFIGLGEDEVLGLKDRRAVVIGINKGYSPIMAKLIDDGMVKEIPASEAKNGNLPPGFYIVRADVTKNKLPLPDLWGLVAANYTIHHIPIAEQEAVIQEMYRVAIMVNEKGERGLIIGEENDQYPLFEVEVAMNIHWPLTIAEAVQSHVAAMRTNTNLHRLQATKQACLYFRDTPPIPNIPLVYKLVISPMKTLTTGYNPESLIKGRKPRREGVLYKTAKS